MFALGSAPLSPVAFTAGKLSPPIAVFFVSAFTALGREDVDETEEEEEEEELVEEDLAAESAATPLAAPFASIAAEAAAAAPFS